MAKCVANSTLGTAPDTYLYNLAQAGNTNIFAAIGSDDILRFFDISLKALSEPVSAGSGLTCLESSDSSNSFVTAGRDGTIRSWDSRTGRQNLETRDPKNNPVSAIRCRDHVIIAGNESAKEGLGDVSVLLYDMRKASVPLRNYGESHTDTITQLAFHPTEPNILLSASTDGLVSFFDINIEDEDDSLQRVLNPRSAVHCAGFFSNNEVYIATMDEHLSIHSLNGPGDETSALDFGDVREKLQCMYIVDVRNDQPNPMIVYGHNINETLSLAELDRARLFDVGARIDLPGAHGEEVVRDFLALGQDRRALSCGEDGRVRVWDLSGPAR